MNPLLSISMVIVWLTTAFTMPAISPHSVVTAPAAVTSYTSTTCPADIETSRSIECGEITLPRNPDQPDNGQTVTLPVRIVQARQQPSTAAPLYLLQGGPGGDTIDTFQYYLDANPDNFPADRDIVFFEPRGNRTAVPSLECPEFNDLTIEYLNKPDADEAYRADSATTWRSCTERLRADGIDFADFNSVRMADDVAGVAAALGHSRINLYGVSYGSLVAQHVVRRYPDLVATLLLDGVVPPQNDWTISVWQSSNTALQYIFADCAARSDCARAYPNLQERYVRLVETLNQQPMTVQIYDFNTGINRDARINGDDLASIIFQMSYSEDVVAYIPMLISLVEQGDYTALTDFAGLLLFFDSTSEGMYGTTVCSERAISPASAYPDTTQLMIPVDSQDITDDVQSNQDRCDAYGTPLVDEVYRTPLTSAVPTLLISGRYDPITPAPFGEAAKINLSNSTHIVLANSSHGGMLSNACAASIAQTLMDDPNQKPDTTCVADQQFVFSTPANFIATSLLYRGITGNEESLVILLILASIWLVSASVWPVRIVRALIGTIQSLTIPVPMRWLYAAQLIWGFCAFSLLSYLVYIGIDLFGANFGVGSRFGIPLTYTGLRAGIWGTYATTLLLGIAWIVALRSRTQSVLSAGFASILTLSGILLCIILAQNGFVGW